MINVFYEEIFNQSVYDIIYPKIYTNSHRSACTRTGSKWDLIASHSSIFAELLTTYEVSLHERSRSINRVRSRKVYTVKAQWQRRRECSLDSVLPNTNLVICWSPPVCAASLLVYSFCFEIWKSRVDSNFICQFEASAVRALHRALLPKLSICDRHVVPRTFLRISSFKRGRLSIILLPDSDCV